MTTLDSSASPNLPARTNGSGAAAILSAATGCFALAVLAIAGDASALLKRSLVFYRPTGPLSGVTAVAILIWLFTWAVLEWRWQKKTIALRRINVVAFLLLGLSFLLTFPPIAELF
jgi:hypothetical protein